MINRYKGNIDNIIIMSSNIPNEDERTFIASSNLFSDFTMNISLYKVSSIPEIIDIFSTELRNVLKENNLTLLEKRIDNIEFHIHGYSIEDILTSDINSIFYICDHKNQEEL